ncbi:MAG: carbamoyltransferase [Candidatus Thiodiazotropha sp. (ex Monitilora ramsayi)]|nr:carbamoyltransferase [Candidatus Thiodiazotropha sp. (ex Monitilora ramsayi)]
MIILGINYFFHDSSACLIKDGELLVALEEERFTRKKHSIQFPKNAIEQCLKYAKIDSKEIDHIAVSIQPSKHWMKKLIYCMSLGRKMGPFLSHELKGTIFKQRDFNKWLKAFFSGKHKPEVHFVEHHLSHVIGTYYLSPYEDAALLSLDGSGEWSTLFVGQVKSGKIERFSETMFPHSLGSFYEAATEFCGFKPNYDEGKTMGLAPFGNPDRFYDEVSRIVTVSEDASVNIDMSYFTYQNWSHRRCSDKFYEVFGTPRGKDKPFLDHHHDVAAAFQRVLEDKVLEICRILERRTDAEYIVLAGGVSLNSVMNGRILRETRFKDVYVMPAAGDNGTSIGAGYYVYHEILGNKQRFFHSNPYVGNAYSKDEVRNILEECKLPYQESKDVCKETAEILRGGNIIGWFQGRMEIGPRALGNRSILADPTLDTMKDKINAEVKHREAYRPFAPSATVECKGDFFDIDVEAPFMLKVCDVKQDKKDVLPAITHVDGSARLQTVRQETNPRYHQLLSEFGKLSGVPVLLNTSFNIMGEPIVESPLHAIRCFFSTGLDVLIIDDFIIRK